MITAADIVRLPYAADLTTAGLAYACQTLPGLHLPADAAAFDRLRRTVAAVAVQLAFRRYLVGEAVPFAASSPARFTDALAFDFSIGGRRCELRAFLITQPQQVAALSGNPAVALEAPALVPLEQYSADGQSANDLYLFAFVTGMPSGSPPDADETGVGRPPAYLIHLMPRTWARPDAWIPLAPLSLKSDSRGKLTIEVGGQDAGRQFAACSAMIPPHARVELQVGLNALTYVHSESAPDGKLGLHSPAQRQTHIIQPNQWGDIYVCGLDIFVLGWITREEFRQRARLIHEASRVFQFGRTRTKNLAVGMSDLKPIHQLLERRRDPGIRH